MDFQKSTTKANLARAFAGECQDGAFYQFVVKDCQQDYKYLSTLLKSIAKNEMAHAGMFYKTICKLSKGAATNIDICAGYTFADYKFPKSLQAALETERKEAFQIYPDFARTAREEGFPDAANVFESVAHDEQHHITMLTQLVDRLAHDRLYQSKDAQTLWLCSNCAHHEYAQAAWDTCPSCGFPQGFVMIELAPILDTAAQDALTRQYAAPPGRKTTKTPAATKTVKK